MPDWLERILSLLIGKGGDTKWRISWSFDLPLFKTGGSMDYEKKAQELLEKLGAVKDRIKSVKSLKDAVEAIPDVVKLVEGVGQDEDLKGSDKKALAVAILNELIDIPFVPHAIEGMLIGWAIDAVIAALNKLVGKDWLAQLA